MTVQIRTVAGAPASIEDLLRAVQERVPADKMADFLRIVGGLPEATQLVSALAILTGSAVAISAEPPGVDFADACAYRPGLPSLAQVRAHEKRGGWWMVYIPEDDEEAALHLVRPGEHAGNLCTNGVGWSPLPFVEWWEHPRVLWRPCSKDGTPCAWPTPQEAQATEGAA